MSRSKRLALLLAGHTCVALGAVGAVLPVMPTTPFLLLAAACYVRSSESSYARLMNSRLFGPMIRDYRERRGVTVRTKAAALIFLWASLAFSMYRTQKPVVDALLLLTGVVCSGFILRLRTLPPQQERA